MRAVASAEHSITSALPRSDDIPPDDPTLSSPVASRTRGRDREKMVERDCSTTPSHPVLAEPDWADRQRPGKTKRTPPAAASIKEEFVSLSTTLPEDDTFSSVSSRSSAAHQAMTEALTRAAESTPAAERETALYKQLMAVLEQNARMADLHLTGYAPVQPLAALAPQPIVEPLVKLEVEVQQNTIDTVEFEEGAVGGASTPFGDPEFVLHKDQARLPRRVPNPFAVSSETDFMRPTRLSSEDPPPTLIPPPPSDAGSERAEAAAEQRSEANTSETSYLDFAPAAQPPVEAAALRERPAVQARMRPPPAGYDSLPVRHRTASGQLPQQTNGPNKVGDASVDLVSVVTVPSQAVPHCAPTLLHRLWGHIQGRADWVYVGVNEVTLTGHLMLPEFHGQAPATRVRSTFQKTVERAANPNPLYVRTPRAIQCGEVEARTYDKYRPAHMTNQREVASTIRGEYRLDNNMANRIAPLLSEVAATYDNVTLAANIWFFLDYLRTLEAAGLAWLPPDRPDNSVTYLNLAVDDANADAQYQILVQAIEQGRICLRRRLLSETDIRCMLVLGGGSQYIRVDQHDVVPIHHFIRVPLVRWTIWETGQVAPVPNAPVTYGQMYAFLLKMKQLTLPDDQVVRGFIMASQWVNGGMYDVGGGRVTYICASLETERTEAPMIRGRSLIWELLTQNWTINSDQTGFDLEWDALAGCTHDQLVALGSAAAAIISVCFSTAFHRFNLYGRAINLWAMNSQNVVTPFMKSLTIRGDRERAPIYSFVLNAVVAMTGCTLSEATFQSNAWCNAGNLSRPINHNELWELIWNHDIPYLVRPESLEWAVEAWLYEWGLNGACARYNARHEMLIYGTPGVQGVYLYRGDEHYYTTRQSAYPYTYMGYGPFMYNTLVQDMRMNRSFIVSFRPLARSSRDDVFEETRWERAVAWQPQFEPVTWHVVPGTWKSYDWERQIVLAPCLLKRDLGPWWPRLSRIHVDDKISWAGFVSSRAVPASLMCIDSAAADILITGAAAGGQRAQQADPQADGEN